MQSFYSRNHGPVPEIDPARWGLHVGGLVHRELRLSLADRHADFAARTLAATLPCAGNRRAGLRTVRDIPGEDPWGPGAISTAEWTGVALAGVLRSAGLRGDAAHVVFEAPDVSRIPGLPERYGSSIPLDAALTGDVLLARALNGEPLPPAHGAPIRVVVPGVIGARGVKWLDRITVSAVPSPSYFQRCAYRLLLPAADADLPASPGGGRLISRVDVHAPAWHG